MRRMLVYAALWALGTVVFVLVTPDPIKASANLALGLLILYVIVTEERPAPEGTGR